MRFIAVLQVLLLGTMLAYLGLVALENPVLIRLPIPFFDQYLFLSSGVAVLLATLLGMLYGAFLLIPLFFQEKWRRYRIQRHYQRLQSQLTATLQARLGSLEREAPTDPATLE